MSKFFTAISIGLSVMLGFMILILIAIFNFLLACSIWIGVICLVIWIAILIFPGIKDSNIYKSVSGYHHVKTSSVNK